MMFWGRRAVVYYDLSNFICIASKVEITRPYRIMKPRSKTKLFNLTAAYRP